LSINGDTQYGAVGGSQWMLTLKLEPLFCVPNPQESESTVLAEVECWHPLATASGSVTVRTLRRSVPGMTGERQSAFR
jgi:hypothetical protein